MISYNEKYFSCELFMFIIYGMKTKLVDMKCDVYGEIFENGDGAFLDDNRNKCYLCICVSDNNFNCKFYYDCDQINCTRKNNFSQPCCRSLKCEDISDKIEKVIEKNSHKDINETVKWVSLLILIIIIFICCIHKAGFIRFTPKSLHKSKNGHKKIKRPHLRH